MLKALLQEQAIMQLVAERTKHFEQWLMQDGELRNFRIVLNHAQICALTEAMAQVFDINPEQIAETQDLIKQMAKQRQQAISADHPLVQEFWDVVEFIDEEDNPILNHSRDPQLIAINLNHFAEVATERKQHFPPLTELKRVLKACRSRKFLGVRTVNSAVNGKWNDQHQYSKRPTSIKCWVFEREK